MNGHTDIDWSGAEVRDSTLTVPLSPPPSAAWRERAKILIERLGRDGQPWGRVRAKKRGLVVRDIADGAADDVRHFLESIVLEAGAGADDAGGASGDGDTRLADAGDARLTAAFRSFDQARNGAR